MLKHSHSFVQLLKQVLFSGVLALSTGIASIHATEPPAANQQPVLQSDAPLCQYPPIKNKPLQDPKAAPGRTHLQADEADMSKKNVTRFSGSVVIQRDGRSIEADKAEYTKQDENFDATGNVRFLTAEMEIKADNAKLNIKEDRGTLHKTRYRTLPENAGGHAEKITVEGPNRLIMDDASYTTCPPDNVAWELNASEITLDKKTRQGAATHAVIDFMGVPFLYLPYLRFPLGDERMSGFLFPDFAVSDQRGTEIIVPYYWNIAPDVDATITAHNMSRRGVMLENEFRYLNEKSQGQIELDYMEDDQVYGDSRQRVKWHHQAAADAGWSTVLDYQKVADNQHLVDFGNTVNSSSTTHLEQQATLSYNAEDWQFNALAQDYQTLAGEQPYRKLPQFSLASRLPEPDNRLNFNIRTEWVRFDHSDTSRPTADRSHIQPVISLPLRSQAGFFIPKITAYYTQYSLSDNAPQQDKVPSRSLTAASLDTGLFLERDTALGNTPLIQTLEPRLFYVYTPYRDQTGLPVFDSGQTDFSFDTLFRENRFTGVDRIGDTNRLTAALTSRLLHQQSGAELFSISAGRVYYYNDRRVSLSDTDTLETENNSDYVARIAIRPATQWSLSSDLQWDDNQERTRYSTTRLTYNRDKDHLITLGHRYRVNELETRDIGFVWRLTPHWRLLVGNQYDSLNSRNLETVYGLNYDSCCWGLRILARQYYNGTNNGQDLYDNAIYLVLELKGLSSFGSDNQAQSILQHAIPGYTQ